MGNWDALGRGIQTGVNAFQEGQRRKLEKELQDKLQSLRESEEKRKEDKYQQLLTDWKQGTEASVTSTPWGAEIETPAIPAGRLRQQFELEQEKRRKDLEPDYTSSSNVFGVFIP